MLEGPVEHTKRLLGELRSVITDLERTNKGKARRLETQYERLHRVWEALRVENDKP